MSNTFLYFAYGSNMLTTRLRARCPSAKFVRVAHLENHVLEFSKKSFDESGKATIVGDKPGSCVQGVLFEIYKSEKNDLDRAEGLGKGYGEKPVDVVSESGIINASTYYAEETNQTLTPYDWYLALVIAGRREHKLFERELHDVEFTPDTCLERKTRRGAIDALCCAGHGNYKKLLPT